jgi:hypothetical protein
MRSRRIQTAALLLACLLLAGPATAQNAPKASDTQAAAQAAQKAPDTNEDFILGLRRVGVIAGQVVECAPEADRQKKISDAIDLANQIAIHFGLKSAFNYVGAVGYGSGHPFDKATCPQAVASWNEIQAKYANK